MDCLYKASGTEKKEDHMKWRQEANEKFYIASLGCWLQFGVKCHQGNVWQAPPL